MYDQLGLKFDAVAESQTVLEFVVDQIQAYGANSMADTPSEARNLLQQFEFPRTRWDERISILSGGERRRMQLLSVLSAVSILIFVIKDYAVRKTLYKFKFTVDLSDFLLLTCSSCIPPPSFEETKLFSLRRT